MFKQEKGVTLVALVITIIVLLILAGVSLSLVVGDQGILTRAQSAVTSTEQATADQEIQLGMDEAQIAYVDAWTKDQSVQRFDYYKQLSHYTNNCVSAQAVNVYVKEDVSNDTEKNIAITYKTKSNVMYLAEFNANKPSTTYSIKEVAKDTTVPEGYSVPTTSPDTTSGS